MAVPDAPRLVASAPRPVAGATRYFSVHSMFSAALRGVPKPMTITPKVLMYQLSETPVTLKSGWKALLGSDTFLKLTH